MHPDSSKHAANAVSALARIANTIPTGQDIASAATIVAEVTDHGVTATCEKLNDTTIQVKLAPASAEEWRKELFPDPEVAAREYLTSHMLSGETVQISHAGGTAQFRVVAIAADHAKVRQLRDGRGPLQARTLHYETIENCGFGHVDTTADLTPATVHGHLEYRKSDRQLAQDLSSTLGNLEHVHRAAQGHDVVTDRHRLGIDRATGAIRDALYLMREKASTEKPAFAVGDRVRCTGRAGDGNLDGHGIITRVMPGRAHEYEVCRDGDLYALSYAADQLTKPDAAPSIGSPIPLYQF